jgi:serine/threonine protein kinase/tetratricopeptide (TPR) repeat protein
MSGQVALGDSLIGLEFAHYRILERVGSGGMGVVYRGFDAHLERDVAIKILHPDALSGDQSRKQFRNEAQALSKLNHPNIATVFDFLTQDGRDFLVMEFIEGITLNKRLLEGSFPEHEALTLGIQLAEGLSAAHERGVVHRDLKPANLRLTPDGRLKILDFGLAKLWLRSGVSQVSETLSETQVIAGTLPYMAPEQLLGGKIDARTDIHAAGTVLYQAATGRPPFPAIDRSEMVNEVLRSAPSPANVLNPVLSAELTRIIGKCLERDPDNRYQSAREFAIDLRRLQSGIPLSATSTKITRSPFWPIAPKVKWIALTVFILAIGLALGAGYRARVPAWLGSPEIPPDKQLAVLPFTVTGNDAETGAFGAGLTETLTAKLTQLTQDPQLQVVPATDVRTRHIASAEEARQEFGVNLVLEGNVHKIGNQIRINYILVDPRTRRQVRGRSLTVSSEDAFRAEDAVVNGAIDMLGLNARRKPSSDLENYGTQVAGAYDYYLQGLGYLENYDREENLDSAIQVFQHALALDKNYAAALAGLGEAYRQKYLNKPDPQWLNQSRDACQKANKLDPQLPAAHACLGALFVSTGNYSGAAAEFSRVLEREPTNDLAYKGLADAYERLGSLAQAESTYKRAIALRPHYWATYNWLGVFYYHQARFHEASQMFQQVVALAPDSVRGHFNLGASLMDEGLYEDSIRASQHSTEIQPSDYGYSNLGTAFFFLRRYHDAIRAYEQAIHLSPNDSLLWWNLGDGYYWASGRRQDSVAAYQKCRDLAAGELKVNPNSSDSLANLAVCQAMLGQRDDAVAAVNRGLRLAPNDSSLMFQAALVYIQFGDREEALRWLAKCRSAGYPLARIRDYPNFESLHSEPRFQELLRTP